MLLMAYTDFEKEVKEDTWFLNSGCSNHMRGKRSLFCFLNDACRENIRLENNSRLIVMGKGSVRIEVNGVAQTISDVFYVPEL